MNSPVFCEICIGMPVYNGANYIREALDSLLAQTFPYFELVISDNASTDLTQAICQEYAQKDKRIRYIRQSKNMGAFDNFKFVFEQSKSKFFMWAAADDYWDKDWLETIYKAIKDIDGVAGVGEVIHVNENSQPTHCFANGAELNFLGSRFERKLKYFFAYGGKGKANLFYSLFPREALKNWHQLGSFDFQILYGLLDRISFVQVKGPKIYKRIHSNNEGAHTVGLDEGFIHKMRGALARDTLVPFQYLSGEKSAFKILLILLLPLKILKTYAYTIYRYTVFNSQNVAKISKL